MNLICLNGKVINGNEPVLEASNRAFRYGDGLFETMKVWKEKILFHQFHFERLFTGLRVLKIDTAPFFTAEKISAEIIDLCKQNKYEERARVRLSVFRSENKEDGLEYLIESAPLDQSINVLNEKGLIIDIYPDARKSCDKFSNLKSASYLLYTMAAKYAKANNLDDSLVLNIQERICEASIANIFWIKEGRIYTPPLSEGCMAGVMRRYLIENFKVEEKKCDIEFLKNADEIFLTNAIQNIRWVKQFRNKTFDNKIIKNIHRQFVEKIVG